MKAYGGLSWEAMVEADPFPFSPPSLSVRIVAHYSRPVQLATKHVVMSLYDIGCDMVSQESFSFFDTYATLSVLGRSIGDIQIQKRPSASDADDQQTNLTKASSKQKTVNLNDRPEPAKMGEIFSITDTELPSFRVFGTFTGRNIAVSLLFAASLNALAQAAVPDREKKGVDINAVSAGATFSPTAFMLVQDLGFFYGDKRLSYNQAARAIACLWKMFLQMKKYGGLQFVIEDSGKTIGSGFMDGTFIRREASVARLN